MSHPLSRVRLAVAASFFVSGAVVSSWVPHIPGMQRALGLSPALLGLVLLAPAVGAMVAMAIAGGLGARFGTAKLMRYATLLYCGMVPFTVLAPHPVVLAAVLALMGLGIGALDVAMNAEAVEVERAYGATIMSSFHALYSLGCLAGAALGGVAIAAHIPPAWHLVAVGLVVGLVGVASSYGYLPGGEAAEEHPPLLVLPTRYLAVLGVGAFCSFLAEGAMADWAAIFMRDTLGAQPAFAATGFAAFSATMVVGRLTGDAVTRALGPAGVVRAGGMLATVGIALPLVLRHPAAAVIGFGLAGLGLATVVPNFFSASGREPSMPSARSIAAVSSFGYAGFLAGPPLIGAIAQFTSLQAGMGAVALFCALIAGVAGSLRDGGQPAQDAQG
ncbi:MAG: Major facilitator superfamily protein [Cyanobacteria bacterium RYN_339]|nr:Major facilitator superfamily protein [Cyanobacteria bacterium RYN_339]